MRIGTPTNAINGNDSDARLDDGTILVAVIYPFLVLPLKQYRIVERQPAANGRGDISQECRIAVAL